MQQFSTIILLYLYIMICFLLAKPPHLIPLSLLAPLPALRPRPQHQRYIIPLFCDSLPPASSVRPFSCSESVFGSFFSPPRPQNLFPAGRQVGRYLLPFSSSSSSSSSLRLYVFASSS